MSTIPESVTERQFTDYILPNFTIAKRGCVNRTPLLGILNLILYRLHMGCQWDCLPGAKSAAERAARREPAETDPQNRIAHRLSYGQALAAIKMAYRRDVVWCRRPDVYPLVKQASQYGWQ